MALTLVTYPGEFDNRATWEVATSLSEGTNYVNVRVEAQVYKNAALVAKKVMPKGYTAFDFSKIFDSLIKFENSLLSDYPGTAMVFPADDSLASNKITSWTNDGVYPFGTFTTSGDAISSAIKTSSANPAIARSNYINFVQGKLYVLAWDSGTCTVMTDAVTLQLSDAASKTTIIKFPTDPCHNKYYIVFKAAITDDSDTSIQLELRCNANKAVNFSAAHLSLYPLTDVDWYVPYVIKFVEKYENASGITQTGATLDLTTSLYFYFKSNAGVFTDFQIGSGTSKFLVSPDAGIITADSATITVDDTTITADGYSGSTRSINHPIPKTIPSGKVSLYYGIIVPKKLSCAIVTKNYNAAFVLQSTVPATYEWNWHPIFFVHLDQTAVVTYPIIGILIRYWSLAGGGVGVDASEEIFVTSMSIAYPQIINLIWKNSIGGYSSFQFYSGIEKGVKTERSYYKNADSKNRILNINPSNYILASSKLHLTTALMEYVSDILLSDQVFWQRGTGDLVEVCIRTESGSTERNDEIMQWSIEFEY